jgi:hypothetical protein
MRGPANTCAAATSSVERLQPRPRGHPGQGRSHADPSGRHAVGKPHWSEFDRGGHVAAMEQPGTVRRRPADLRGFTGRPVAGSGRADAGRCPNGQPLRRPILRECGCLRLFLDLVAQKCKAVLERGGLDQLQVLPIFEDARSPARDAGQTSIRTSSTTPAASRECMSVKLPHSQMSMPLCSLSSRMVATGSRVTVAAGKSPQGASSSFDETTNLVRLLSFSPYSPCSSAYCQ